MNDAKLTCCYSVEKNPFWVIQLSKGGTGKKTPLLDTRKIPDWFFIKKFTLSLKDS